MSLVFTQLASDNFQRANENPLSQGGNWTTSGSPLQVLNDTCTGVAVVGGYSGLSHYTGISWPLNAYNSITIGAVEEEVPPAVVSFISIFVAHAALKIRNDSGQYVAYFFTDADSLEPALAINLPSVSSGDVFTLASVGSQAYFLRNNVVLASGLSASSQISTGYLEIDSPDLSGTYITGWAGGSVSLVLSPTNGTLMGPYANISGFANPVQGAFPQNSRNQLDLFQIINPRGGQVVWKLDCTGTVTASPASWTSGTVLGQIPGASWTACFQQNNTNPRDLDVLQIIDEGGAVVWWLDYTGTVYSAS